MFDFQLLSEGVNTLPAEGAFQVVGGVAVYRFQGCCVGLSKIFLTKFLQSRKNCCF
jgi:hypothetical protein